MEEELIEGKNAKYCLDKNCEKNGQLQPFEAYCAQARGKYGYASACRNCVNRKRNEARQKRREEYHSSNGLTHKLCQGLVCIGKNPNGVNIPVSDFGTDKKEVDGLYYICRKCKKARDQEYYEEKKKKRLIKLAEETKNDNIIDENCEENEQDVSMQICRGILCKGKVKKPLSEFHKKCNRCKICRKAESKKKPKVARKKFGTKLCKGELCRKVNPLGIMKDVSEFATNTGNHDGLQSQCKDCKHDAMAKHYTEKDKVIQKIYDNTKKGQQKRAKKLEFSITLEDILSKLEEQNGKCALSGTDLTHIAYGKKGEIHYLNEDNMSIDRIDSNKGYIKENIQLVTARINRIKSDLGNEEFELFCKATLTWHDKKEVTELPTMLGNYAEEKLDVTKIPGYENPKIPKKRCPGCKLKLPTSCFDTDNDAKDRLQGSCKFCQRQMHLKYLATLDGNITIQFKDISNRAQKKKLTFEITKQDIIDLYHKQNGLCALTGNVLTYTANMADGRHIVNPRNLSVDRIDSTKGYTKDNIQLVGTQINRIKDNLTIDKLIEICRLVVAE